MEWSIGCYNPWVIKGQRANINRKKEFGGKSKNKGHRTRFSRSKPKGEDKGHAKGELVGVIKILGRKGGVIVNEKTFEEIRIEPGALGTALNGDTVKVNVTKRSHRQEAERPRESTGRVTEVIARAKTRFVGVIQGDFLVPDDRRVYTNIFLPHHAKRDANEGDKAVVEMLEWKSEYPEGRVLEVLGRPGEHETEIKSILGESGIVYDFPTEVEKEAESIKKHIHETMRAEIPKRRDMRHTTTFTIDPLDAKDFDDALSIKTLGNDLWEVGIHIADVSFFVNPGTALDNEAAKRANSTYLVDRTIPMLPHVLSGDICSLVPNQDRLTYSSIFHIDSRGKVSNEWFGRTVIHSIKRFTYETAQGILDSGKGERAEELKILWTIASNLHKERLAKGSIVFDKEEVRVEMDEHKRPKRIYVKEHLATHSLIEEFMLLANAHVAHFFHRITKGESAGTLYRIHDSPNKERIENLKIFLQSLGYKIEGNWKSAGWRIGHKEINALFAQVKGADIEELVQTAVLRSMAKAIYSVRNIGHFGLGFDYYTHFTSPIRRYPDTVVHRMLTKHLDGKKVSPAEIEDYEAMARYSSEKERESENAERESIKFKQAEFMAARLGKGEIFEGTVVGVTEWGLFVAERDTRSEGLVRVGSLGDDYYEFNEKKFALIGSKTKKTFRLGDRVKVKLAEVDIARHQITWELV
jgi:ribonuclease R